MIVIHAMESKDHLLDVWNLPLFLSFRYNGLVSPCRHGGLCCQCLIRRISTSDRGRCSGKKKSHSHSFGRSFLTNRNQPTSMASRHPFARAQSHTAIQTDMDLCAQAQKLQEFQNTHTHTHILTHTGISI